MGRKKQMVEEKTVTSPSTSFGYSGKINVSLQKGKRTYFTKTYKNHGRWPLFYFLNMCLAGDYSKAETFRPKFINVFDFDLTGETVPEIIDGAQLEENKITTYFNSANCISVLSYPYMSQPDVNYKDDQNGSSTLTYKFTIPFTQIGLKTEGGGTGAIEGFALYASQTAEGSTDSKALNNISNPCAYFFLTDGNKTNSKVKNLLEDLDSAHLGDEYNLYIEWTLSIVNQERIPEASE